MYIVGIYLWWFCANCMQSEINKTLYYAFLNTCLSLLHILLRAIYEVNTMQNTWYLRIIQYKHLSAWGVPGFRYTPPRAHTSVVAEALWRVPQVHDKPCTRQSRWPTNKRSGGNDGNTLGQRLWRWPSVSPALGWCLQVSGVAVTSH